MNDKNDTPAPAPRISVVVPVYNRAETVAAAVESALAQDVAAIEVVCVDDASTDGSRRIVEELAARDGRVRPVVLPENRGTGFARKAGILAARGEYTLFLDADDRFLPNVFGRLLAEIVRRRLDVLQFRTRVVPLGGFGPKAARFFEKKIDGRIPGHRAGDWRLLRDQTKSKAFIALWNKIYRTAPLREAALLFEDGRFTSCEDVLLTALLLSRLPSWGSTGLRGIEYRVGGGSIAKAMTPERFEGKLTRAGCCRALRRFVEAETERLIPGYAGPDGDDRWTAAPEKTRLHAKWLNRLCSHLEVFMMEATWENIPDRSTAEEREEYQQRFFDAFGAVLCQKFFSRGASQVHVDETLTFRIGAFLLRPATAIRERVRRARALRLAAKGKPALPSSPRRVAIVTFHAASNYGAVLQAYALQRAFASLGVVAEVLDYRSPFITWTYDPRRGAGRPAKGLPARLALWRAARVGRARNAAFAAFVRRNVVLSPGPHYSVFRLGGVARRYDAFVAGSDQVFSILCSNLDPAYFLTFVDDPAKKFSYAASFGLSSLPDSFKPVFRTMLGSFRFLSLREESGERIVKDLLGPGAPPTAVHPDPTLLLDAAAWSGIAAQSRIRVPRKYLLLYNVNKPKRLFREAARIARERGLALLYLGRDFPFSARFRRGVRVVEAAAPQDFVRCFRDAECVLTNSFHGTVFSVLFRKPFYVELETKTAFNDRAQALLSQLGLEANAMPPSGPVPSEIPRPDWDAAERVLVERRRDAARYLRSVLPPSGGEGAGPSPRKEPS